MLQRNSKICCSAVTLYSHHFNLKISAEKPAYFVVDHKIVIAVSLGFCSKATGADQCCSFNVPSKYTDSNKQPGNYRWHEAALSTPHKHLKGYIHQGDHTPTCLQAETLCCLYFTICLKAQLGVKSDQSLTQSLKINLFSVLTFGEHVLHDRFEFVGTDLHVLMDWGTIFYHYYQPT